MWSVQHFHSIFLLWNVDKFVDMAHYSMSVSASDSLTFACRRELILTRKGLKAAVQAVDMKQVWRCESCYISGSVTREVATLEIIGLQQKSIKLDGLFLRFSTAQLWKRRSEDQRCAFWMKKHVYFESFWPFNGLFSLCEWTEACDQSGPAARLCSSVIREETSLIHRSSDSVCSCIIMAAWPLTYVSHPGGALYPQCPTPTGSYPRRAL